VQNGDGIRNPRARQRALLIAAGPDEPELSELSELLRTAGVAAAGALGSAPGRSQTASGRHVDQGCRRETSAR